MRDFIVAGLIAALSSAAPAAAQTPMEVRVAPGLVWHGAVFGDDDPKSAGGIRPTASIVARAQLRRMVGLTFEAMVEPIGVRNPHFDERLHSLHALAGAEIGRRFTIRPAIGLGVQLWSGSRAGSGISLAPAVAVAFGHRHMPRPGNGAGPGRRRWTLVHFSPEIVARASYSHGAVSWMAGVQTPFTWRR